MSKRTGGLLTQAEVDRERLSTMARVFQRADRVLSGENIRCSVAQGGVAAPAWSDGEEIAFNAEQIGAVTSVDDIIKVTGLNYHELSHVLYTPRKHTSMVKAIIADQVFPAFNMLEDQRIETLLSAKYPSTKPYFVACIMRYLLANRQQWDTAFPLLHGRKYLPLEVRQQAEARFKDSHLVPDFKRIINEYRTLAYPRDDQRGLALVREYAALLGQMTKPPSADPNGHGSGRPEVVKGQPQPHEGTAQVAKEESKDEDDADTAEGQGQGQSASKDDDAKSDTKGKGKSKDKPEEDADDTDDDAQGSGSGDDADDEDDFDWDADDDLDGDTGGDNKAGSQKGSDSDDDSDDDGSDATSDDEGQQDDASSSKGGKGAGKGGEYTPPVAPVSDADFADLMDKAASQAEQDEKVQEEVRDKQDVIVKGDGEVLTTLDQQSYTDCQVPPSVLQTAKRFGRDLRRLRDEVDPGWHSGQSAGRLNVGRAMRGDDLDTVFDKWDEGKHLDADIEVVILLDYSDSMASMMDAASQSMWTIKRAFEEIGGRVTVIGYSYGAVLMYDGNTKVKPTQYKRFAANGGTVPEGALKEALRLLHASKRQSKFLVSITDGAWGGYGSDYKRQYLDRFNDNGVVTAMLFLMRPGMNDEYRERIVRNINWQGHAVQAISDGAEDLADLSMGIVKARLRLPSR